ncbi:hypothetical protein YC2023_001429 [Brassica napus]
MEDNKKRNPNSHECNSWSELPLDLLNMVFKRLGFVDFQRAKSVCSSWLSSSRQSVPKKNHTPWLILFPEEQNNSYCKLFNPEEKERLYKTQDTGLDFSKSVCEASYGSWLLMHDLCYNLHIVNIFTNERIILPSLESQLGLTKERRTKPKNRILSCLFWIDEQIPETSECLGMVYKDHKLYFLNYYGDFCIFDFYGETPQQTFQRELKVESVHSRKISSRLRIVATKLVATVTGNVLLVQKIWRSIPMTWSFLVIKVYSYSSGNLKEHQLVNSLGNESMLFDQGITVLANETYGFIANSIYFSGSSSDKNTNDIFLFNLERRKMEQLHKFDCSSLQLSSDGWFLPSFTKA